MDLALAFLALYLLLVESVAAAFAAYTIRVEQRHLRRVHAEVLRRVSASPSGETAAGVES